LIQAGSGLSTFGVPNSPGVTEGTAKDTLLANYNDIENVKAVFEANKNEIAAIIIEPVAGNMGCIPPKDGFLNDLRQLCNENNTLLIFDEVMTGFRLAKGGVQELSNVKADIVCFGKVIGGGLPVGAFAGRNEIMNYLAPIGPVYQAGTLSGNPLAMAAGLAMLEALNADQAIFQRLEEKTAYLERGIQKVLLDNDIIFTINRVGSMISVHFDDKPVVDFQTAKNGDNETFKKFFHGLLNEGIYIAPSAYETWFITDALTYEDLDFTINAVNKVAKEL
jgi:glutamate-1-semialdehyde 2,1-aminomutase